MPVSINMPTISVPTIAYVIKDLGPEYKKLKIRSVLQQVDILPSHKKHVDAALKGKFRDIEDAMQYACALENACDLILTRDEQDFNESAIPVMSPAAFLSEISF